MRRLYYRDSYGRWHEDLSENCLASLADPF